MCGITGYILLSNNAPELKKSLEAATQSLLSRGPDNQATFLDKSIGLGHTRLSIIDTSNKANQPMTDHSGRYTLIFNGEIYNYRELANALEVDFNSTSDTEVLLYLLIEEGEECLTKLNGFFAFAFYDSKEESLLIARDRMGIKPLHYYQNGDFFAFGSEMKALLSYPIARKIDQQSLYWYLRLTYLPADMSMIAGIKKLQPGHFIRISNSCVKVESYWSLEEQSSFNGNYTDAKDQTVKLLEQSVQRRMIADVPLGSFLSGGTDSSAV
ncbi:MAG: asparagine synthetase B, partial [Ekhidna sp.]